jgi:hypothetical protein
MSSGGRSFKIRRLDGPELSYSFPLSATFSEVKHQLFIDTQIPTERQRLIFKGKVLLDNQSVAILAEDNLAIHLGIFYKSFIRTTTWIFCFFFFFFFFFFFR